MLPSLEPESSACGAAFFYPLKTALLCGFPQFFHTFYFFAFFSSISVYGFLYFFAFLVYFLRRYVRFFIPLGGTRGDFIKKPAEPGFQSPDCGATGGRTAPTASPEGRREGRGRPPDGGGRPHTAKKQAEARRGRAPGGAFCAAKKLLAADGRRPATASPFLPRPRLFRFTLLAPPQLRTRGGPARGAKEETKRGRGRRGRGRTRGAERRSRTKSATAPSLSFSADLFVYKITLNIFSFMSLFLHSCFYGLDGV